jgi:hypothetical protein
MGLAAVAAFALTTFAAQPSYARTTDQGGLRTSMIDSGDRMESKDVVANGVPVGGAPSIGVTETLHYINEPFWAWKHNTQYTIKRTVTATYVGRIGAFVVHDNEGDWYEFAPGNAGANKLPGKPQASIGAQPNVLDRNDRGSLAGVAPGGDVNGTPQLSATYNYVHPEALDDVSYSVSVTVGTTFVADQNAWFANVSGRLYRVDHSGQVTALSDKPSIDRGELNTPISSNDSTASYPDVTFSGGFFEASWRHVHEEDFQHVRYTTRQEVRADFVPEVNAYMAWIDGTEYSVSPGSSYVDRLNNRPVVQLGPQYSSLGYDRAVRVDVYSVNDKDVVVRSYFHRNETYVAKEYYVDQRGVLYYNQNWQVWMVAINGTNYVVDFDSDNFSDPSVSVIHAPAGATRPQYSVPSTSGDGLPPAVVPGRDPGNSVAPPPANNGGIPGRAPAAIPGRSAPPANNCIPGRC